MKYEIHSKNFGKIKNITVDNENEAEGIYNQWLNYHGYSKDFHELRKISKGKDSGKGYIYKELKKSGQIFTLREPKHITALAVNRDLKVGTEVGYFINKEGVSTRITRVYKK